MSDNETSLRNQLNTAAQASLGRGQSKVPDQTADLAAAHGTGAKPKTNYVGQAGNGKTNQASNSNSNEAQESQTKENESNENPPEVSNASTEEGGEKAGEEKAPQEDAQQTQADPVIGPVADQDSDGTPAYDDEEEEEVALSPEEALYPDFDFTQKTGACQVLITIHADSRQPEIEVSHPENANPRSVNSAFIRARKVLRHQMRITNRGTKNLLESTNPAVGHDAERTRANIPDPDSPEGQLASAITDRELRSLGEYIDEGDVKVDTSDPITPKPAPQKDPKEGLDKLEDATLQNVINAQQDEANKS